MHGDCRDNEELRSDSESDVDRCLYTNARNKRSNSESDVAVAQYIKIMLLNAKNVRFY